MTQGIPPPVVETQTPYNTEYRYGIQWMSDTYGSINLKIDNVLLPLVLLKAKAILSLREGKVLPATTTENMLLQMINKYNMNEELIQKSQPTVFGD